MRRRSVHPVEALLARVHVHELGARIDVHPDAGAGQRAQIRGERLRADAEQREVDGPSARVVAGARAPAAQHADLRRAEVVRRLEHELHHARVEGCRLFALPRCDERERRDRARIDAPVGEVQRERVARARVGVVDAHRPERRGPARPGRRLGGRRRGGRRRRWCDAPRDRPGRRRAGRRASRPERSQHHAARGERPGSRDSAPSRHLPDASRLPPSHACHPNVTFP